MDSAALPAPPTPDASDGPASAMTQQLLVVAVVNLVVLGVAWGINKAESRHGFPGLPATFIVLEVVIFLLATLLCSFSAIAQSWRSVMEESLDDPHETERISDEDGFRAWWLEHRASFLRVGVIVLPALMVLSLDRLVHASGGGLHSPFMPLLEAPAVLGPFIARKRRGLLLSVVAVSIAIGIEIQTHVAVSPETEYRAVAHTVVTVLVVVVAGAISAEQKSRKSRNRDAAKKRPKSAGSAAR
jgi:hypothetical protein